MRIGSLCSGYGGLDLGLLAYLGSSASVAWHVEFDDAPGRILDHHWPGIPNHLDVTDTRWADVEPVDWLTAGYPCQPFSLAGKRKGATDERHLWPYIAHAIGVLRPGGVLLENVAGHVSLGLGTVLGDLARLGYDARWGVVRASEAGAPHRRARVFIVAADTRGEAFGLGSGLRPSRAARLGRGRPDDHGAPGVPAPVADTDRDAVREQPVGLGRGCGSAVVGLVGTDTAPDADEAGSQGREPASGHHLPAWGAYEPAITRWERIIGRPAPTPVETGPKGGARLSPRFVEWLMGLPAGHVTDVPGLSRNAQLKALGNGVVPQQAALALKLLTDPQTQRRTA